MHIIPLESDDLLFQGFVDLPWSIYSNKYSWVPPTRKKVQAELSKRQNLFFQHGDAQAFVCLKGDKVIGRIVASYDNSLYSQERCGHFGYLELISNVDVAARLLQAAEQWLREQDRHIVYGPVNLNIFHGYRLQIRGFDTPAFLGEPRAPAYYQDFLFQNDYEINSRWRSFNLSSESFPLLEGYAKEKADGMNETGLDNLSYTNFPPANVQQEWVRIYSLVLESFKRNFHCPKLSGAEYRQHIPSDLFTDPGSFIVSNEAGKPVAFCWGYKDYADLLINLDGAESSPDAVTADIPQRMILNTIGILNDYRSTGLAYEMFYRVFRYLRECGFESAIGALVKEGPCIYETCGTAHKEYAIFRKQL